MLYAMGKPVSGTCMTAQALAASMKRLTLEKGGHAGRGRPAASPALRHVAQKTAELPLINARFRGLWPAFGDISGRFVLWEEPQDSFPAGTHFGTRQPASGLVFGRQRDSSRSSKNAESPENSWFSRLPAGGVVGDIGLEKTRSPREILR